GPSLADDWDRVWSVFEVWADQPGLSARLRAALRSLPPEQAAAVAARSRETTTHFAWCLVDSPDDPFSFWINEYKPHRDWLPGYADSIHTRRYHSCTTILSGGYLHEDFRVVLAPTGSRVTSVPPAARQLRIAGSAGHLQADEFHRIPEASDGTITFLVKSRPVKDWSLSFEPVRQLSHRHVPVEARFPDLLEHLYRGSPPAQRCVFRPNLPPPGLELPGQVREVKLPSGAPPSPTSHVRTPLEQT